jgi:hypothetical protein
VQLKGEDGNILQVVLNKQGVKLGKQLNGKKAEVMGTISKRKVKKALKQYLTVKSFKEMTQSETETESEPSASPAGANAG